MKKYLIFASIGLLFILISGVLTFQYSRSWQNAFFLNPIYKIKGNEKVVALTFDDGPSPTRTPALLDLLNKHSVKATFFLIGQNIEKYPEIAQAVYNQGHLIGNHSYSHPRLIFKSSSFVREQINKTEQLIKSLGQTEVTYFRPPYTSKYIILPLVLNSLNKELVTGTYDPPSQYISPYNAINVANEVIVNTEKGSIVYLHDGKEDDQQQFIESVELIILGLKENGYKFVRVDYKN